jgi:hypothetical protein
MARFWTYIVFVAWAAIGGSFASAHTQVISPESEFGDGLDEGQKLTCGAARDLLTREGYQGIAVRSCFTFAYAFTVERNGKSVRVFVDPENGRAWEG